MAKKYASQKDLYAHSEAKVKLLGDYLDRYLNILSSFVKRIHIYDLFCGEGLYPNGKYGSSLTIMEKVHILNENAKDKNIPPIDVHFNDLDSGKIENLENAILTKKLYHKSYGSLEFSSEDYKQVVTSLSSQLPQLNKKGEKAFIFIDPYGYKEVRASEIKELLKNKNSEVLLFLPTQHMYRFSTNGTPESLVEFLDEIVDYSNWKPTTSVWNFIDELKNGFRDYLGSKFYVDTFTIKKDRNTVFCLFFFSSHIRGFEKMLEVKWKLDDDEGRGWSYEQTGSLFASLKTNLLAENLEKFIKSGKKYNGDVYKYTLENGFLPKHTTEIFKDWQKTNKLLVFSGKDINLSIRKSSFYINYKDYNKDYKKVFFQLK